ncbi:hypothetical protein SOPP22_09880 [Shewanella sp. OPT22]|nr:hypothetical protein SOPP22_09880 [Shewanella sp. OPT22]
MAVVKCEYNLTSDHTMQVYREVNSERLSLEKIVRSFLAISISSISSIKASEVTIDIIYLQKILGYSQSLAKRNNVTLNIQQLETVELVSEPILVSVLLQNLLNNAINCSINGNVHFLISEQQIDVIDDGVGLNDTPRGYEGFGVGLQIVRDICARYNWEFQLKNNTGNGCTASVIFNTHQKTSI